MATNWELYLKRTNKATAPAAAPKKEIKKEKDIWFDDVPMELVNEARGIKAELVEEHPRSKSKLGRFVAMDCEMVGVGKDGVESALARVSIVNFDGHVLLDLYVRPLEKIVDYRTQYSGILPKHMKDAVEFHEAQKRVADVIKDRILIGHAIYNDLEVLMLSHPRKLIRDTSRYKPFRKIAGGRSPALRVLAKKYLGIDIQAGSHCSVEDARVTLKLYKLVRKEWEAKLWKPK